MTKTFTDSVLTQRDRLNIQLFSVALDSEFEKLVAKSENFEALLWEVSNADDEIFDKWLASFQGLIGNKSDEIQEEYFQTLKKYLWTKN